jgi:GntR family transcriptional regulator
MAEDNPFVMNIESPVAVYTQIENQVQFAIASGRLKPGDALPSVRDMSQKLNVNPNTITKAYRDLELLHLVHTRRGVGVTVSEGAPDLCRESTAQMVREHLTDATAECVAAGVSIAEIRKVVAESISSKALPYQASRKR